MAETDTALIDEGHRRMHAELIGYGYRDVTEHRGLKPGARVWHGGHRWPEAYMRGSATVLAVMRKDPSPWADSWGRPDVEVLAAVDRPMFPDSPVSQWADYHCEVIAGPAPSPVSAATGETDRSEETQA